MKIFANNFIAVILFTFFSTVAYSHPGHGVEGHWLHSIEPIYYVLVFAALIILAIIAKKKS